MRSVSSDKRSTDRMHILSLEVTFQETPMIGACITNVLEARKYLRESCYHYIKCFAANFLAAFMWRRPLNSAALAIPTHKGPKRVSDVTSTQVMDWMINKWRAKIIGRELYNVRDPWQRRDRRFIRESTVAAWTIFVTILNLYKY